MSSSSDSVSQSAPHLVREDQVEGRRNSKYGIYGSTTKPFGEGYRRSQLLKQEQDQDSGHEQDQERESEVTSVDTDSVEGTMGCSESRSGVSLVEETVKGTFVEKGPPTIEIACDETDCIEKHPENNDHYKQDKVNPYESIYTVNNNTGYSTTDLYTEVKKPEKSEKEVQQTNKSSEQSPREKLMQQIRDRKDESKENTCNTIVRNEKVNSDENSVKSISTWKNSVKEGVNVACCGNGKDDKITNTIVTSAPVSFLEEEYSYEPDKKESTTKLVVRSRSLANLDQNQYNYNSTMMCTLRRPNKLKMTTKPDGSIRYGFRSASSESDLLDNDSDSSPSQNSEVKSNYVNSIKSAFDAAIESQKPHQAERAEAFDGLRQYFHDNKHGLQKLLINNNVVIIEPFRQNTPPNLSEQPDLGSQRTCRITGATIKSPVSEQKEFVLSANTLPRRSAKSRQDTRQGFYHPIKVNKELIDAELPDPDKVKSARELFENVVKSNSATEIPSKAVRTKQCFNTMPGKMRITPQVKVIQGGRDTSSHKRRQCNSLLEQGMREDVKRYPIQRRWTDSGSLSSGVSSDFSCDQDWEYHHQNENGSNQDILEEYSSTDEDGDYIYPYESDERHPVSLEVLQKIRACGTTVTYYGGKVISTTHGQLRSPMTMSIMDEIRQSGGSRQGRRKDSDSEEPYLGVKFRLVKSNSCGSRLEIAGTEDYYGPKLTSPRHEDFRGKSIEEEVTELKEESQSRHDKEAVRNNDEEETQTLSNEEEEDKVEADRYSSNDKTSSKNPQVMTWAELKLKEARKLWHCTPEAVRVPQQDMEFETFEVLDESSVHKTEKTEGTGRG